MFFTVTPADLKSAIAALSPAFSSKNIMPVLDNILIIPSADHSSITLVASNGDITINTSVSVSNANSLVMALIPIANIKNYTKDALGLFDVDFKYENGEWTISDTDGDYRFICNDVPAEYPVDSNKISENGTTIHAPASELFDVFSAASKFVASDELRPVLNGVYFDFKNDGLYLAASDSKRLFIDCIDTVRLADPVGVIVPSKMTNCFNSLLSKSSDNEVTISFDAKNICFSTSSTQVRGRLIEGRYPRYDAIVPKNNNRVAEIDVSKVKYAIKRGMMASNNGTCAMKMTFDGSSKVVFSSQDIDFSLSATVNIDTIRQDNTKDFYVGLRGNFLYEVISSLQSKSAVFTMSDPTRAVVIKDAVREHRLALVMPQLIQ